MYSAILIAIMSIVTLMIRALPFFIFKGDKELPSTLLYLQKVLPMASMAMLVVYCLKSVSFIAYPYGLPEIISCAVIVILQWVKGNTILTILIGTFLYMFLVQCIF